MRKQDFRFFMSDSSFYILSKINHKKISVKSEKIQIIFKFQKGEGAKLDELGMYAGGSIGSPEKLFLAKIANVPGFFVIIQFIYYTFLNIYFCHFKMIKLYT